MFPLLKNKRFTDLVDNKVVTVTEQFENIAILDSGQRIDVKRLLDPSFFDEYIDPKTFLGDTFNVFAEKIKSIDLSQIKETPETDSAIIQVDPAQERREMEQKALEMSQQLNPNLAAQKQAQILREILGEDGDLPQINNQSETVDVPQTTLVVNNQPRKEVEKVEPQKIEDPIITMFKNVKRNKDFSFSLNINGKIPRLDFIEMMEDSYETSIIEYLANEFTQNLISNPDFIKSKIIEEIKSLVYPTNVIDTELEVFNDTPEQPLEIINDGSSKIKPRKSTVRKKNTQQQ